jgi:hypothetical protein
LIVSTSTPEGDGVMEFRSSNELWGNAVIRAVYEWLTYRANLCPI